MSNATLPPGLTQYDAMVGAFTQAGVEFVVLREGDSDFRAPAISAGPSWPADPPYVKILRLEAPSTKCVGYSGHHTEFCFDEAGQILQVGIWE